MPEIALRSAGTVPVPLTVPLQFCSAIQYGYSNVHVPSLIVPDNVPSTAVGFVIALWLDWQFPLLIDQTGTAVLRALFGSVFVAGGAVLFWWGMATFARARTGILLQQPASRLVIRGPYQWTRNPQYVGYVAGYFGFSILANTLWPLLVFPFVIGLLVTVVISREERYLQGVFGSEYVDYCRRVNRWL